MRGITARQLDCVRARVATGTTKGAGHRLGLSPSTVRTHLAGVCARLGVETIEQAVYVLTVQGELEVPDLRRE